jgi:chemotaxis protein MotB
VVTSNMANMETTRTPAGGPYRRQLVVFRAQRLSRFPALLAGFGNRAAQGVSVDRVLGDGRPPLVRYQPGHPDADAKGYVSYSTEQMDRRRAVQLAAAIHTAFQQLGANPAESVGTVPEPLGASEAETTRAAMPDQEQMVDLSGLKQELEKALAGPIARDQAAVQARHDGLVISLREGGFFDSGSAGIKLDSEPAFNRMAAVLEKYPYNLRIEGHTDDVSIHTARYHSNWELSTARATEIVRLLILKHSFAPQRLSAAGYAEYHPIASNRNPLGRALNRRVDVVVLGSMRDEITSVPPGAASP